MKSFTAEAREVEALDALSREYEEANQRAINLSAAFSPLIRMAIVIGFTVFAMALCFLVSMLLLLLMMLMMMVMMSMTITNWNI